jgi:ABC-type nitrate/sulfonate/bicarbonate transport system permease component
MIGRTTLRGVGGLVLLLGLWQLSVPLVGLEPWFYPSPADVGRAFIDLLRKGILPVDIVDSLQRYLGASRSARRSASASAYSLGSTAPPTACWGR